MEEKILSRDVLIVRDGVKINTMKNKFKNIVVLTGAGISAESGIRTFRDSNGLWEDHAIEDVASPEGFQRDPSLVYRFYNARREQLYNDQRVAPNAAHKALAKLQRDTNANFTLITQNVDNLHERGGSENVLHMHGRLDQMRCTSCASVHPSPVAFNEDSSCPSCDTKGSLRPNIVWFGEMPFYLEQAAQELERSDLFMCIGTSGLVYPAAQFVSLTNPKCMRVEFNLNHTPASSQFSEVVHGPAGQTVPDFIESLK